MKKLLGAVFSAALFLGMASAYAGQEQLKTADAATNASVTMSVASNGTHSQVLAALTNGSSAPVMTNAGAEHNGQMTLAERDVSNRLNGR